MTVANNNNNNKCDIILENLINRCDVNNIHIRTKK